MRPLPFLHPKLSLFHLPWPADWNALFGQPRPLIVEIGFGNGAYLLELARHHPQHNIIGLEIASRSLEKAERKIGHNDVHNARVIFSKAEAALPHLFTPGSIHEIHINYPDPWFKDRHSGRRLMQRDTLDWMVSRLVVGGRLYLATDIEAYAVMSDQLLADTPALRNLLPTPWTNAWQRLTTTKYEAKGYLEGRPGHFFAYERTEADTRPLPTITELPMPHLVIRTPQPPAAIIAAFAEQVYRPGGETYIKLRDAFLHQNGRAMMFEAEVIEPTIEQHVAIMLFPRENPQEYTVKYTTLGNPRMTRGLHLATNLLAEWVVGLHPEAAVLARKVSL